MPKRRHEGPWPLQDAKNRFSQLVEQALAEGPQIVTRRGRETAVVLGYDEYLHLTGEGRPDRSFSEFLLAIPKVPGGLVVQRRTGAALFDPWSG